MAIQSEVAARRSPRALTAPPVWIAPAYKRNFSVRVVLPASGCEMMAKVRLVAASLKISGASDTPKAYGHIGKSPVLE
jgi:hypothetical protein